MVIKELWGEAYEMMLFENYETQIDAYLKLLEERTILLPDGYNGHKMRYFKKPIKIDGDLIQLQCAENGKEYLHKWTFKLEA